MAQDPTQALQWASQNPNDPRAKDIQAKAWALANPDDPRADQVLAQVHSRSGAPDQSAGAGPNANPYQIANTQADQAKLNDQQDAKQASFKDSMIQMAKTAVGTGAGMIAGAVKGATLGNVDAPHILGLDRDPNTSVGTKIGTAEGNIGIGSLLGASLPEAGSALGRVGSAITQGAVMGGLQAPDSTSSRPMGALKGAAIGGTLGTAGEGIQSLLSGAGRVVGTGKMALQMSRGDPALQAQARNAIGDAAESLGTQTHRPDLDAKLAAAQVEINPTQYMGHSPEVDQLLRNAIAQQSPTGTIPSSLKVSGTALNDIRRQLDAGLPWKQQAYGSLSPQQIKSGGDMLDAANNARTNLHSISPDIDQAFNDVSSAYSGQSALNKMSAKPLTALTSKNLDQKANISSLGDRAGTNLGDLSSQLRSAKKLSTSPLSGSLQLLKQGAKGASNSLTGPDTGVANNPQGLSAILSLLK